MKDIRKKAKNIVTKFFNLTYMGHWWVFLICGIIGFPTVVDPGKVIIENIMILDIFFTWIFGPIFLLNFLLMIFKFLKEIFKD